MEELLDILSELHPDIDFETADGLIDDGILDSLDIVTLVTEIDARLGVTIPAEELVPDNFNSLQAIWDLIERIDED